MTPYTIAFIKHVSIYLEVTDIAIDCLFVVDIVFNFFIAYYDQGYVLVDDWCSIAAKYLRTWFAIDLFSVIPVNLVFEG